jgi:hypothetical protein
MLSEPVRALVARIKRGSVSDANLEALLAALGRDGRLKPAKLPPAYRPCPAVTPDDSPGVTDDLMRATTPQALRAQRESDALVAKFSRLGVAAVDAALRFAAEWETLQQTGNTRMPKERYVEVNMVKEGLLL